MQAASAVGKAVEAPFDSWAPKELLRGALAADVPFGFWAPDGQHQVALEEAA